MSDYPRPPLPVPPKPYPPDRWAALVLFLLVLYSTVKSILKVLHHPPPSNGPSALYYGGVYMATLAIYGWLLWGIARSRFWAFMTVFVLLGLASLSSALKSRDSVPTVVQAIIALLALSRLCTLIGPRPIRRADLPS